MVASALGKAVGKLFGKGAKEADAPKRLSKAERDKMVKAERDRDAKKMERDRKMEGRINIDKWDEYNKQRLAKGGMVKKPAAKSKGKK